MRTPWGYDVDDQIEPIITRRCFDHFTGGAYASNPRVDSAIAAASQAIRNYCGWHITPALDCTASPSGGSAVMRLPASYVSAITQITEDGVEVDSAGYRWRADGLVKRTAPHIWSPEWGALEVKYTAGYSEDAVPDLVEAVCSVAAGVISVSPGVVSESADGVAVSYSVNASSIAAALTSAQKNALEPYKVVGSHAA